MGLDRSGARVQKLEGDSLSVVAGAYEPGVEAHQLQGNAIQVTEAGVLFVADNRNHRVQRWAPGAASGTTVAGGHGPGHALNQLNDPCGIHVANDETLYVADKSNDRVVKWRPGASQGMVIAGGFGQGSEAHTVDDPFDLALDDDGALYIAEGGEACRVTRWGPARAYTFE